MTQTILNFKLQSTNEKLTPRTGVAILGEYLKGMNLRRLCNDNLPKAKRNNGYSAFEFIYPIILMLHSGGRFLDDIREIKVDNALTTLLKIKNIPTANAFSKYLRKHGTDGEDGMRKINKKLLKQFLKSIENKELILDIDATFIEAHKNTAKYSYKDAPGYMPMVGHINGGFVIDVDFREGNEAPASKNLEFIKQCVLQLPLDKKFDRFRADSASYQADIFNYCEDKNILFTITAKKNKNVFDSIKSIKDEKWQPFSKREKVAEFTHTMQDTDNAFRMIVIKKDITPTLPTLEEYISNEVMMQHQDEIYYCIATNDNDLTPAEIIKLHRQRGETSENKIKELKNGFNMSIMSPHNSQLSLTFLIKNFLSVVLLNLYSANQ